MQSACTTGSRVIGSLLLLTILSFNTSAQDNSPWSRYGLGDIVPASNITNRGMGGAAAAYGDFQTINFINPASYSNFGPQRAIFDIGLDINNRTLRNNLGSSYTSANAYIPYMAAGFQIKPQKSKMNWGLVFGLRPITKVSYKIISGTRISAGDSVLTQYEGNGGTYQAFAGTGIGFKNLSIGVNGGYRFGSKDYTTRVSILNDTVGDRYTPGQREVRNNFGSAFLELGLQYRIPLNKKSSITLGAYGSMQGRMNVTRDEKVETYFAAGSDGVIRQVDSIYEKKNIKGSIEYPSYFGAGLVYDVQGDSKLMIALDYTQFNWANYRYFETADALQNAWQVKAGAQFLPNFSGDIKRKSYWSSVLYRAGFHYGLEPYTFAGSSLNSYGITFGIGLPIRKYSYAEINRSNIVNAAIEFGQRGNKDGVLRENYFRLSLGFSLSDVWFIKRKYD
ncbi:hypothetical protein PDL71_00545 [Lacibacter sp. MH-610]|uniref:hypothetical protein n=1 Tax=Lacibacter sp. MH-610 TaxID=3020883 RepID=UPI003892C231